MITSAHYAALVGEDTISKTKQELIHNLVNTAKAFYKDGKTSCGRAFHCCFAISHGKVKDIGFNNYRYTIDYLPSLGKVKKYSDSTYRSGKHAEIDVILKLGKIDFSRMIFLNVHIDKNLKCRMSRPCLNCLSMMKKVGVKQCWYFEEDENKWLSIKTR